MLYRCSVQPCLTAIPKFKPRYMDIISTQKVPLPTDDLVVLFQLPVDSIKSLKIKEAVTSSHTTALPSGERSVPLDAMCY